MPSEKNIGIAMCRKLSELVSTRTADQRKILTSYLTEGDPKFPSTSPLRIGVFDNQGSPKPWTWAWTTDSHSFEVWRPSGIYLLIPNNTKDITIFKSRAHTLKAPVALSIGKTGPISYGIVGLNSDGSKVSIVKDTYPFFDAHLNVAYDGLCEDEDFYPLLMIGREMASRLQIQFNETIHAL